ncbi:hypothetical protein [Melittangium boletus]|uniref:Uncharacterized protein n=1 Tax=Melittangium boletus DSM 14713 TaxID=1294270 RepID=A0A250I7S4_9BACT|nr:hypothetical protein [Melittangium boletus]ATB27248.1 hypothetical protein MEBOL_000686 [Melittangium boletus DSM 14713]
MWKQLGLVLAVALVGLGPGSAEARFGKRSNPPPSNSGGSPGRPSPSPSPGHDASSPRPRPRPSGGYYSGYFSPYGYYGDPWNRYAYFDPAWAWPFMGPYVPSYGRYYVSAPDWRRSRTVVGVEDAAVKPITTDFFADGGAVSEGYSVGLGMQTDGERFGFGLKLNLFNLATDDGSPGRDSISLISVAPSILLVNRERVTWRVSGGLDAAFAPDVTMVGPGLGTSARLGLVGPLKLEASAHLTPLPYVQLNGDAGLAVDLGLVRLRGGYRATYLNDQGAVDGNVHRDFFRGPYAGFSLVL